jgi:hypothetical protein
MYRQEKITTYGTQDEEKHNTICVRPSLFLHAITRPTYKKCPIPKTFDQKFKRNSVISKCSQSFFLYTKHYTKK